MIGFQMVGDRKLRRNLKRLTGKQLIKAVKSASGKAMTPVSRAIRKNIHLDQPIPFTAGTGLTRKEQQKLLKKSIGKRTKNIGRGSAIFAVAGVKGGYKVKSLGLPSNAAHMVEYGTRNTKPQPFIRPAMATLRGESLRVYTRELAAWITKNA